MKIAITTLLLINAIISHAGVEQDMRAFFDDVGASSNVTDPRVWQSQAAGHVGGGSLYLRHRIKQTRLMHMDLPSVRSGCGGIDVVTGSFSVINGDQLKDLGKQIMASSGAYAFDLALANTVPQIKDVVDRLQDIALKINQSNINSCQLAQNLVGGVWPKTQAHQEKICRDVGTRKGLFADYTQARMQCQKPDAFQNAMNTAANDKETKTQVLRNTNLVWSLLKNQSLFNQDTELAEFVMNLTGTIVFDKHGQPTAYEPKLTYAQLASQLLAVTDNPHDSTTLSLWRCDNTKTCTRLVERPLVLQANQSLTMKAHQLLDSLQQKLKNDNAVPSVQEQQLLNMTSIPAMRLMMLSMSQSQTAAMLDKRDLAQLIAQDLLANYIENLLQAASESMTLSQIPDELIAPIQKRLSQSKQALINYRPVLRQAYQERLALIERMQRLEQQTAQQMKVVLPS